MLSKFTREQQVVVRVCNEWLKEVGLPLYSELTNAQAAAVPMQPCTCGTAHMCSTGCSKVVAG